MRVARLVSVAVVAGTLAFASSASAHLGRPMHLRYEAQANLRIGLIQAGYFPRRLTCNVERRIIGVHFICYLVVLGRERLICYHAIRRGGPAIKRFKITPYRGVGCRQFY